MQPIILPESYNYCSAFLTFACSFNCSYCINHQGDFKPRKSLSGKDWIKGLSRIETRNDLPLTLSGGEPTFHPDFYSIVKALHKKGKYMDLLSNGEHLIWKFINNISPEVFRRNSKYANIRISFHSNTNENYIDMLLVDESHENNTYITFLLTLVKFNNPAFSNLDHELIEKHTDLKPEAINKIHDEDKFINYYLFQKNNFKLNY